LSEGKVPLNFPEANIANTPAKTAVQQLATEISSRTTDSSRRLQVFMEKYEKEFKQDLADKRISYDNCSNHYVQSSCFLRQHKRLRKS
jgi:hypothetical protein